MTQAEAGAASGEIDGEQPTRGARTHNEPRTHNEAKARNEAKAMLLALREVVRRAWQTLAVLRDPDLHYFRRGGWLLSVIHDLREAYGYSAVRARRFTPTSRDVSQMDVVMGWMAWLRRSEGDAALKRIMAWAMGTPIWRMARREGCSERTIANRIDRSLNGVLKAFADLDAELPIIEEAAAPRQELLAHRSERPGALSEGVVRPGRVWIDGIGYMREGERGGEGRQTDNEPRACSGS